MTFSSPYFYLLFLPFTLLAYEICGALGRRFAIFLLAFMSCVFYAVWNKYYLLLLLGSIAMNYLFAVLIARTANRPSRQSLSLTGGILANLALLCYYKYLFPALAFVSSVSGSHHFWRSVILPLGISFFTFTQIAYLIDLKQGVAGLESPLSYTLFVTFFPHLVAGPIIHHKEIMPQLGPGRHFRLNRSDLTLGLTWFAMGMFKKVMLADRIAPSADALYANPHGVSSLTAWYGVLAYAMQLYFDFSGYSDMALGLARMFSIEFPLNFNSPYKSSNIIDFWQRWHMTLTRYIMNYVYSPMQQVISRRRLDSGKKISRRAMETTEGFLHMVAFPTIFTLFLAGVWHGAGFQFLIFGLVHGVYLVINHAWRLFTPSASRARRIFETPISVVLTFLCVVAAQILFRANSLHDAFVVFGDLLGRHGAGAHPPAIELVFLVGLFLIVWLLPNTQEILDQTQHGDQPNRVFFPMRWSPNLPWWLVTTASFLISMFYSSATQTFLYFQF